MKKQRTQIRTALIQQRKGLSPIQQRQASKKICQNLMNSTVFLKSHRVAYYFAYQREVDPSLLIKRAWLMGKECYFPVLHRTKHRQLWFAKFQPGDSTAKNYLGILEPDVTIAQRVALWSLDIVIVPLVAFDQQGNRIGMGAGYYDRTFAFLKHYPYHKPKLVGLAYDFQELTTIATQPWDIPLDYVATESSLLYVNHL